MKKTGGFRSRLEFSAREKQSNSAQGPNKVENSLRNEND